MLFNKKERWMIVGLGNPGREYERTRHNAGFMALDALEEAFGAKPASSKRTAELSKAALGDKELLLVRPMTFMNLSGNAVNEVGAFYKIPIEHIIVVSDDVALDVGRLRIRNKGSDGGQKGLRDIIRVLGTDRFFRVRLGVGQKPHPDYDMADWVLSKFPEEELKKLQEALKTVPDAVRLLVGGEFERAQNQYNR